MRPETSGYGVVFRQFTGCVSCRVRRSSFPPTLTTNRPTKPTSASPTGTADVASFTSVGTARPRARPSTSASSPNYRPRRASSQPRLALRREGAIQIEYFRSVVYWVFLYLPGILWHRSGVACSHSAVQRTLSVGRPAPPAWPMVVHVRDALRPTTYYYRVVVPSGRTASAVTGEPRRCSSS